MSKTIAKISGMEEEYACDYLIDNEIKVEIYNGNFGFEDDSKLSILIEDLQKTQCYYSPYFYNTKITWSKINTYQFSTNFYFYTERFENIDELNENIKVKAITFYNPMLIHYFTNSSVHRNGSNEELTYTIKLKDADKEEIIINSNNIQKIEFGSVVSSKERNHCQTIIIETENYIKLYLEESVGTEEILSYISEMDSFINAYCPTGLHSYKTTVQTESGKSFYLYHKLLGAEKYYNKSTHRPIKTNFFDYLSILYKNVNFRNANNKNQYLLLDFKRPVSLEDQFVFYLRYIDLFVSKNRLTEKGVPPTKLHERIRIFLGEFSYLFEGQDKTDLLKLKNEINSLRAYFVHEGYYFENNQFTVTNDDRSQYKKDIDYDWLYRITMALKLSAYTILYKEVLGLDLDENELKYSLYY